MILEQPKKLTDKCYCTFPRWIGGNGISRDPGNGTARFRGDRLVLTDWVDNSLSRYSEQV